MPKTPKAKKPRKMKPMSVTYLHDWLCEFATQGHMWMAERDTTIGRFPEAQEMFALRELLGKLRTLTP